MDIQEQPYTRNEKFGCCIRVHGTTTGNYFKASSNDLKLDDLSSGLKYRATWQEAQRDLDELAKKNGLIPKKVRSLFYR